MQSIANPASAVVVGASGGIGRAVVDALQAGDRLQAIFAFSRTELAGGSADGWLRTRRLDLKDEASIERAAASVADAPPVRLVFVATGMLHHGNMQPEKTFKRIDPAMLQESFAINAIGPALVAKHFLPLLPRQGKAVFAALSARVGSIGDNHLGGWYSYRASKAALNMLIRSFAIELARTHPEAVCVGLHPGTVDTGLSRPFQSGVPEANLFTAARSAAHLLAVIDGLKATDTGRCIAWDGTPVPP